MKLVRDNIPQIDQSGKFTYRPAKPAEIGPLLAAKLREEVEELIARPCIDEFADVSTAFAAFCHFFSITGGPTLDRQAAEYAHKKNQTNGGFFQFIVQEPVESLQSPASNVQPMKPVPAPAVAEAVPGTATTSGKAPALPLGAVEEAQRAQRAAEDATGAPTPNAGPFVVSEGGQAENQEGK